MDLRITNYGTDAREYTLLSKVSSSRDYSAAFALLSFVFNATLLSVAYIVAIPTLLPFIGKSCHSWCPVLPPDNRQYVLWTITPLLVLCFVFKTSFGSTIIEESLLVIPQIGVQLRKKQRNGHENFMFIEAKCIKAIVINEAISFSDVIYYLAFLVQDESKMVLAFDTFRPRVVALQKIYSGTKHLLFPDDTKMSML
ncbi:Aste57867_7719 [Aphanomyces stellatus]|uniref:Aste57867_7719 protein n=1 Tax=Aphanomyces stellatus TaxID=120398 RepID=A0A485KIQ7_9STRA|nr:hypothetical protein As57867_007690 [Aphanomyces stellatus]VFT84622.1 Aste57867_7719 [Aphanomyces stellatus]